MWSPRCEESDARFLRYWEKREEALVSSEWLSRSELNARAHVACGRLCEALASSPLEIAGKILQTCAPGAHERLKRRETAGEDAETRTNSDTTEETGSPSREATTDSADGPAERRDSLCGVGREHTNGWSCCDFQQHLKGVRMAHYMTSNRLEEVVLRLAASVSGYVPVTLNWDADNIERVLYKIYSTHCKAVIVDAGVPAASLDKLCEAAAEGGLKVLSAEELCSPIAVTAASIWGTQSSRRGAASDARHTESEREELADGLSPEPRAASAGGAGGREEDDSGDEECLIVFTSGTTGLPKGAALSRNRSCSSTKTRASPSWF